MPAFLLQPLVENAFRHGIGAAGADAVASSWARRCTADACASRCATTAPGCRPASISRGTPAPGFEHPHPAPEPVRRPGLARRWPRRPAAAPSSRWTCRPSRPPISPEPRHDRLPGPRRRRRAAGPGDGRRAAPGGSRGRVRRRVRRRPPGPRADRRAPPAHRCSSISRCRRCPGIGIAGWSTTPGRSIVFVTAFSRYAHARLRREGDRLRAEAVLGRALSRALERAKRRVRERRLGELAHELSSLSAESAGRAGAGRRPRRRRTCSASPSRSAIGRWC